VEVVNCPRCGKVFTRIKNPICPACEKEEELIFQSVKEYIDEHSESTLSELSEGTGVSPKKILRYIREGRLEISSGMRGDVRCEVCGGPVSHGRYCDACKIKMNQNITDMFSKDSRERKESNTMHIAKNNRK
jgi:flagellar operon protein (TIGR03826 family)